MSTHTLITAAHAAANALIAAEDEIEGLDRAIGDGDHFHNMKRGAEVVLSLTEGMADKPPSEVMKAIGMKLMSTIGGASGPLTASFFIGAAKTDGVDDAWTPDTAARLVNAGVAAIQHRGKANRGDKTMLDTLIPVAEAMSAGAAAEKPPAEIAASVKSAAADGVESTRDILATKGRAAFLGERAIGHIDPGAKSCAVMAAAICDALYPS